MSETIIKRLAGNDGKVAHAILVIKLRQISHGGSLKVTYVVTSHARGARSAPTAEKSLKNAMKLL